MQVVGEFSVEGIITNDNFPAREVLHERVALDAGMCFGLVSQGVNGTRHQDRERQTLRLDHATSRRPTLSDRRNHSCNLKRSARWD
jgi:hypothetical protein